MRHGIKGEQTRLKIVRAAADLAHRRGFRATGLQEILSVAGVPKGSFYFYFKSKEEVGQAVVRYRRDFLLDELHRIFDRDAGLEEQIRDWFAFMIRTQEMFGGCLGCPLGNLAQEVTASGKGFATEVQLFYSQAKEILRRRLAREDEASLGNMSAEEVASFLLMTAQGALLMTRVRGDLEPLHEAERACLHLLARLPAERVTPSPVPHHASRRRRAVRPR